MGILILTWPAGNARNVTIESSAFDSPLSFAYYNASTYSAPVSEDIFRYSDSTLFTGSGGVSDYYIFNNTLTKAIVNAIILDLTDIKYVSIGNHVTDIGYEAFRSNTNLLSIEWRDTLNSGCSIIGVSSFRDATNLQSMSIPSSIKVIDTYAFRNTAGMSKFNIPEGVTSLGLGAFEDSGIEASIVIPDSLIYADSYTFNNCTGLTSITLGSGLSVLPSRMFKGCNSVNTLLTIPEIVNTIGGEAFQNCTNLSAEGVSFGSNVISIGNNAFNGIAFNYIEWVAGTARTASIGNTAFTDVVGFGSVFNNSIYDVPLDGEIFDNDNSIRYTTFIGSTINYSVLIDGALTKAYVTTALGHVTTIVGLSVGTFVDSIGNENDTTGTAPFYNLSSLEKINFKSVGGCSYIGDNAFGECAGLNTYGINFPTTIVKLNDSCFKTSGLSRVVLNEGLVTIGPRVFEDCFNLVEAVFPATTLTTIGASSFKNTDLTSSITLNTGVLSIGENAFEGCSNLAGVTFPSTLSSLGISAFAECESLSSITLPASSLEHIGESAFGYCTGITSLDLGGVSTIGDYAFAGNTGLTSVTFPESVTDIGDNSFVGTTGVTAVTMGSSVVSVGINAFRIF
jgi:hypothetical protein